MKALIKKANTDTDIMSCFPVMAELRPHLVRENFLHTVKNMKTEGFQLAYIETQSTEAECIETECIETECIETESTKTESVTEADKNSSGNNQVVAVAGYRIYSNLFMGKHLYVDDLVTAESVRSKGYGELLMDWLKAEAKNHQCQVIHLDSGTHRGSAHKFYFNQGFTIASYHFSQNLNK